MQRFGRFRGKFSLANRRLPHALRPSVTSTGSMSSCFVPHGHVVSTTSRIRLLFGIFCTLNGRSQPDEWQLVSLPFNGLLWPVAFNRSGCSMYRSVRKSHVRACLRSGVILGPVCTGGGTGTGGGVFVGTFVGRSRNWGEE